jgi:hypothetical protein
MRNDTIGAEGIASVLNFQEGPCMMMECLDGNFHETFLLPDIRHLNLREIALFHQGQEVRDLALLCISNQVLNFFHL